MNNFIIVYMESFSAYDPTTKTGELHAFLTIDISLRSFPFHSAWRTMTHDKSPLPKMRPCLIMMNYEPKTKTENRKQKTKTGKRKPKTMTVACGKSPFPGSRACGKSPFPGSRAVTLNGKRKPVNLTSLRTLLK